MLDADPTFFPPPLKTIKNKVESVIMTVTLWWLKNTRKNGRPSGNQQKFDGDLFLYIYIYKTLTLYIY